MDENRRFSRAVKTLQPLINLAKRREWMAFKRQLSFSDIDRVAINAIIELGKSNVANMNSSQFLGIPVKSKKHLIEYYFDKYCGILGRKTREELIDSIIKEKERLSELLEKGIEMSIMEE